MFDAKSLLDQFLGSGGQGGQGGQGRSTDQLMNKGRDYLQNNSGGLATGALAGGLAGLMLGTKTGRKLGSKAVTYGGMALVAGLAYKAYKGYQAGQQSGGGGAAAQAPGQGHAQANQPFQLEAPRDTAFDPVNAPGGENNFALVLLTAMVSAAKADGHIDADEQARIFEKIDEAGLGAEEKAFLMDELRSPLDIDKVVAGATTPEAAAEIYAASRLAIDPDHAAEQAYLQMLSARLGLDQALVNEIEFAVREAENS